MEFVYVCVFYSWICCSLWIISSVCLSSLLCCSRTRLSSCIWSCVAFFFSSCRSDMCASFMASRAVSFSRTLCSNATCLERVQNNTSYFTAARQSRSKVHKLFIVHISHSKVHNLCMIFFFGGVGGQTYILYILCTHFNIKFLIRKEINFQVTQH